MPEREKISIVFSEEVTERYLEIAGKKTAAEFAADCMPSGVTITIEVEPVFGCLAYVEGQEIGEVELFLT